jgi:hypothetical protein
VEAAGVLGDNSAPGNGHGEKQRIETGVIEALADEFTRGDDDAGFAFGNGGELRVRLAQGFPSHAALEDDEVWRVRADQFGEKREMFRAFC